VVRSYWDTYHENMEFHVDWLPGQRTLAQPLGSAAPAEVTTVAAGTSSDAESPPAASAAEKPAPKQTQAAAAVLAVSQRAAVAPDRLVSSRFPAAASAAEQPSVQPAVKDEQNAVGLPTSQDDNARDSAIAAVSYGSSSAASHAGAEGDQPSAKQLARARAPALMLEHEPPSKLGQEGLEAAPGSLSRLRRRPRASEVISHTVAFVLGAMCTACLVSVLLSRRISQGIG